MGSGKTTVATALALRLKCEMIDLDEFIETREGRSIHSIINDDGESRFRQIETEALLEVLDLESAGVIALGGGTWTIEENRLRLKTENCFVVWLDAPFELCWRRIEKSEGLRPLAADKEATRALFEHRQEVYELAHARVAVSDDSSVDSLVDAIVGEAESSQA
jgi:shikimate kinase